MSQSPRHLDYADPAINNARRLTDLEWCLCVLAVELSAIVGFLVFVSDFGSGGLQVAG